MPALHRAGAQAVLQDGLGLGQLRARVHAAHLVLRDNLERHAVALRARDFHGVGQVIFAGLVGVADALQEAQQRAALKCHDPRIAQGDGALFRRRVLLLADGQKLAARRGDKPPVALGGLGLEARHNHLRAAFERPRQGTEAFRRDQRRVAVEHENRPVFRLQRCPGGQHRMRRAQPLGLHEKARFDGLCSLSKPGASGGITAEQRTAPAWAAARSTCATSGAPASGCSTFGSADFMRVPVPPPEPPREIQPSSQAS